MVTSIMLKYRHGIYASILAMMMLGFYSSILRLFVPEIQNSFLVSYTLTGSMYLVGLLPAALNNIFGGYLADHIGRKLLIVLGALISALAFYWSAIAVEYGDYLWAQFSLSIGASFFGFAAMMVMLDIYSGILIGKRERALNVMHLGFALGCIFAPLLGKFLQLSSDWRFWFKVVSVLFLACGLYFASIHLPRRHTRHKPSLKIIFKLFGNKELLFYGSLMMLYVGAEFSYSGWLSSYLQNGIGLSPKESSFILMVFFILFALGRTCGVLLSHRFTLKPFLLHLPWIAGSVVLIDVLWLQSYYLLPIIGFIIAPIFATIQHSSLEDHPRLQAAASAVCLAVGSIGAYALPFLIGNLNDRFGVRFGFLGIAAYFFLMTILTILWNRGKNVSLKLQTT